MIYRGFYFCNLFYIMLRLRKQLKVTKKIKIYILRGEWLFIDDTIAAIATAPGEGGIGIIRI